MKNEVAIKQFKATTKLAEAVDEAKKAGVKIENGQVQFSNPLSRGLESLFVEGLPGSVRDIQRGLDEKAAKKPPVPKSEPKETKPSGSKRGK